MKFVAFLRGINVGGHHKVAMSELKELMFNLKFKNIETILNSGNIIFEAKNSETEFLESTISESLESHFGFKIPTLVRKAKFIFQLIEDSPFKEILITKDIRLYTSFLKSGVKPKITLPWKSEDGSYKILLQKNDTVMSVLDLSRSKTPKAMEALEKFYGKDITTRNWNTILKIGKKLKP